MSLTLPGSVLEQFHNPCFIETGTYGGDGVKLALDCGFTTVHSIEVDPERAALARERFANEPGVTLHEGDSGALLGELLDRIESPITFWLGAHDHENTGQLPRPAALLSELSAIHESGRTNCTILIDDIRILRNQEQWGSDVPGGVDHVLQRLLAINPRYTFNFYDSGLAAGDILAAVPTDEDMTGSWDDSQMLTRYTARRALHQAVRRVWATPVPDYRRRAFRDRGVVIPGGGLKYFPCLWVCVNMLRHLGCTLPIQVWHLGPKEMPDLLRKLLVPLGVECVDAYEVRESHPVRRLGGWELKPFALLYSPFREVLLLDADNVAVRDPTYLFDTEPYRQAGAAFWPDYGRLGPDRSVWGLTGVPYRDEPEFESGQVLIDKARCWRELLLTMWFNEHSDFWYSHFHGDKESFHLAWRKLGTPYAMPDRPIHSLEGTMCQHDFEGQRIFQHRNMAKWRLNPASNPRVDGFEHEEACLGWLAQLEGRGIEPCLLGLSPLSDEAVALMGERQAIYTRVGYETRTIRLGRDGRIEGAGSCEAYWHLEGHNGSQQLTLLGEDGSVTATLFPAPNGSGQWRGAWHQHERMPVELCVDPAAATGAV